MEPQTPQENLVTVGLYYEVKPGMADAFMAKFEEIRGVLAGAPGHVSSHLYRRVDDPDAFAVIGEWSSRERFVEFVKSETFRNVTRWGLAEALRGRPRHKSYPRVESLDRPQG